ncbi:MAG: asparagine synthase (glutamine-hydrolyzing) [Bryobacteraceae bacterium]
MCGIAGFAGGAPVPDAEAVLRRMTTAIAHRGPDDNRYYNDSSVSLGHRRLSIIDLSSGHQPMTNEDGGLWLIYNGEIFNHADLRPRLEAAGHRYVTHCDTETILHAYEQYGPDCVKQFRGMFAFVIWNKDRRTLFCARDRLGIKPFYYHWDGERLVFASEIKALLCYPGISAALDESTVPEYLAFGYLSGEQTMFRGIRKLMPGHHLTLNLDGGPPRIERYWDVPRPTQFEKREDADWVHECRQRLEETVRMRLMSDVPLGMFLSGGVDSSAIAALMKRMVDGPVKTFAVGYNEAQYSELSYARQVANSIGTEHNEIVIGMEDFFNVLPNLIWHEDEPITWPSSVSLYFVSKLAAEQVKVVLTGEGSDELFAGYARYHTHGWNEKWSQSYDVVPAAWRDWIRNQIGVSALLSASLRRKLQHTFVGRAPGIQSLYLDNFYSAFPGEPKAYENFMRYWNADSGDRLLPKMLYADQKTYLVELLMKQDQMSMANSIESRVPFLDHPFVEFAAGVPDHMKLRNGEGKFILKRAIEDLLPHDIIYRKKMGFPTPLRSWLQDARSESLFRILRDPKGILAPYIDRKELESLLERQRAGREDCTDRLWRLLNFQLWGDLFITGRRGRHESLLAGETLLAR